MITYTRLGKAGRLGNQLWQVASTLGIAQSLGQTAVIPANWDYRPYFKIPDELYSNVVLRDDGRPTTQAHHTERVNHIDPRAREYLQDLGLWKDIAPQIWSWFQPSELAMTELKKYEWFAELPRPILSVHVRRGDNAAQPNPSHPLRPASYYHDSIKELRGEYESIVVFSDDPEWCRTEFGDYALESPIAFLVGRPRRKEHEKGYATEPFSDWIDLQMMTFCDRHIISNSTYAWWGAWLSRDPSPVYPVPFFGPALDYIDTSLMFPKEWIGRDHGQIYL